MPDLFDPPGQTGPVSGSDGTGPESAGEKPLAEAMRPASLSEMAGQQHLIGEDGPLRKLMQGGKLHSMLLWGPPGSGKTTLAKLLAQSAHGHFIALSAVFSGVRDIRDAVAAAKVHAGRGDRTIIFVDEIHRFNKSQQDALLPFVESGLLTLIGATTENPSFEVNRALLSRAQVYRLDSLDPEALVDVLQRGEGRLGVQLTTRVRERLSAWADGDARRLLNGLQMLVEQQPEVAGQLDPDDAAMDAALQSVPLAFDKQGDHFYDLISALHKSVRGSSPDAALYWLCRMLQGGADPRYLGRRLIRMAWEDVGLADPRAATIAELALTTWERLGSPEGELALAQAVLYLAAAPKSNAGYTAYKEAQGFTREHGSQAVPAHLRNAPTALMREQGFGKGYRYSHDEDSAYSAGEQYFPEELTPQRFYHPVQRGLEIRIAEKLQALRELDRAAARTLPG